MWRDQKIFELYPRKVNSTLNFSKDNQQRNFQDQKFNKQENYGLGAIRNGKIFIDFLEEIWMHISIVIFYIKAIPAIRSKCWNSTPNMGSDF